MKESGIPPFYQLGRRQSPKSSKAKSYTPECLLSSEGSRRRRDKREVSSTPSWKPNLKTTSQKSSRWLRICDNRKGRSWERQDAPSPEQWRSLPTPRTPHRGRYESKPSKSVLKTRKNKRKLRRKRRFFQSILMTVLCSRHNVAELFKKMYKISHYKLHFFNALLRKKWRKPHLKHQRIPSNDLASL